MRVSIYRKESTLAFKVCEIIDVVDTTIHHSLLYIRRDCRRFRLKRLSFQCSFFLSFFLSGQAGRGQGELTRAAGGLLEVAADGEQEKDCT